ncbi:MAG: hypothetical protein JWS12_593 [Candidatus Saccharibacteria bacterium]|nr:hypothetical protein [Candidatus Saccharibacteria bacterium]
MIGKNAKAQSGKRHKRGEMTTFDSEHPNVAITSNLDEKPGVAVAPHSSAWDPERLIQSKPHIVVVILVVIGVIGGLIWYWQQTAAHKVSMACTNAKNLPILQEAASELNPEGVDQLRTNVDKIQKLPHYKQDPNCLYTLISYYIITGDANTGRTYLGDLRKVYKPKVGFNAVYGSNPYTPDELAQQLSFVDTQNNQVNKNSFQVKEPAGLQ